MWKYLKKDWTMYQLSTEVQTEAPKMPFLREQRVPRLGETSQQVHYRVEGAQQSQEYRCRQAEMESGTGTLGGLGRK